VLVKTAVKQAWRRAMTLEHDDIVELDSAIMMHPRVWEASGHVGGFSDPLVENKKTNQRFRVDHLLEDVGVFADEKMPLEEIQKLFDEHFEKLALPSKKREEYSEVKKFNLLVESNFGSTTSSLEDPVYLRGETAQGIYVNFKQVLGSSTLKVPFGIAQIGKAFRNEIKPRQFIFRVREFEQMEMQYFVHPESAAEIFEKWKELRMKYYTEVIGLPAEKLRLKQHENLVFYAKDAWDIEYKFDFGWKEIEGIHWRGDYDLTQHKEFSGNDTSYLDPYTNERFIPHVVEVSSGLERVVFALLHNSYEEQALEGDKSRVVLHLPSQFAPNKVCVSPLLKNKPDLVVKAREIFKSLKSDMWHVAWDDNGNIGKRYRRQDEIGTPACVVVDFDTLEDQAVTVRDRDTQEQKRVKIADLREYLRDTYSV
jgi:glycyl-tRNA synthetase